MKKFHTFTKDVRSPNVEKMLSIDPAKKKQIDSKKQIKVCFPKFTANIVLRR